MKRIKFLSIALIGILFISCDCPNIIYDDDYIKNKSSVNSYNENNNNNNNDILTIEGHKSIIIPKNNINSLYDDVMIYELYNTRNQVCSHRTGNMLHENGVRINFTIPNEDESGFDAVTQSILVKQVDNQIVVSVESKHTLIKSVNLSKNKMTIIVFADF